MSCPANLTVAAAIIERDGRFLVTRRAPGQTLAGMWEFPGGKVDLGETLSECLKRELAEELGIEAVVGSVVAESIVEDPRRRIHLVAMRARIQSGELSLSVHDQSDWLNPHEILKLDLAPADIPIAIRLLEEVDGV